MNGSRAMRDGICRAGRLAAACTAFVTLGFFCDAHADSQGRISVTLAPTAYVFDSQFFGLANGLGIEAALRYELGSDIYFENGIGMLKTSGSGVSVDGLDYRINLLAIFPVLIPYRPVARFGIGVLSVNPITVTPTTAFRPTQTTFYILGGAGVTRSIVDRLSLEAGAEFWITPYEYRIYRFNRADVAMQRERFTHLSMSIGVTYTF